MELNFAIIAVLVVDLYGSSVDLMVCSLQTTSPVMFVFLEAIPLSQANARHRRTSLPVYFTLITDLFDPHSALLVYSKHLNHSSITITLMNKPTVQELNL